MENILECSNLFKYYSGKPALYNLNVSFPKGKIIGLLGPNGSGKTTLIKIVAGLLTPSSGTVTINGMKPGVETKNMISYLPERQYFSSWMTVNDILTVFNEFYTDFDIARARDMMQRLGITPENKIKTLSKGTKEKVQLVLVMSRRAKLYLLDEPIGGVDPATRDYILNTIITNYNEDSTIIISTHLIYEIEKILDDFVFINRGQIVMGGEVDRVRAERNISIDELFREVFRC
ncbi:MAG: ABC transporter ATP-binding protein [Eubacteriales bacterium]|nr:ABC transporter ATP-binding protein [Eubacteriales bacterium]MDD4422351.1 ABC transporter ATP-binding protein [Eubacteriales bacterium]HBR30472.1 ABC transporter ATP-binding protein [Clostridiales bacterium]